MSEQVANVEEQNKSLAKVLKLTPKQRKQKEDQDQPIPETWGILKRQISWYKKIVVFLLVLLLLSFLERMNKYHTVTLVPPNLSEKVEVTVNSASANYKKRWAVFAAQLIGNITPYNIDTVIDTIGPMLDPSIYQDVMDEMRATAEQLRLRKASGKFEIHKVSYNAKLNKAWVYGYREIAVPNGRKESEMRTYVVVVDIEDGSPVIKTLDSHKGKPNMNQAGGNR